MGIFQELEQHRLSREAQIVSALSSGPARASDLVPKIYADVDKALWPAAERNVLAHFIDLYTRRAIECPVKRRGIQNGIDIGVSISHSGASMTVIEKGPDWYAFEVSDESLHLYVSKVKVVKALANVAMEKYNENPDLVRKWGGGTMGLKTKLRETNQGRLAHKYRNHPSDS